MGIAAIVSGIVDAISSVGSGIAGAITSGAADLGIGPATAGIIGSVGEGALSGGALGALGNLKQPLKGAEYGALTGGTIAGLGPAISGLTGLGTTASDTLAGGIGGTLGGLATGQKLGPSALGGAVGGLATGALSSLGTPSATPGTTPSSGALPGGTGSAVSAAAPSSVPSTGGDVTSGGLASANLPGSLGAGAATGTPSLAGGATPTPAAPAAAAPAAGASSDWGKFLTSPEGLLTIGGLGASIARGSPKPAGVANLTTQANQLLSQGNRLGSYLETGTLPPGLQESLGTATNDAATAIKSKYAQLGMSGSSAEAQDLQNLSLRSQEQGANEAMSLMAQGTQDTQLGTQLYEYLIGVNMQQDQQLSSSIGNFTSAIAQMGRPVVATGVGA